MGVVFPRQMQQQREARNAFRMALALAETPTASRDLGILAIHYTPAGRGRPHNLDIVRQLGGQEDLVLRVLWSDSDDGTKPLVVTWRPGAWLKILERVAAKNGAA